MFGQHTGFIGKLIRHGAHSKLFNHIGMQTPGVGQIVHGSDMRRGQRLHHLIECRRFQLSPTFGS